MVEVSPGLATVRPGSLGRPIPFPGHDDGTQTKRSCVFKRAFFPHYLRASVYYTLVSKVFLITCWSLLHKYLVKVSFYFSECFEHTNSSYCSERTFSGIDVSAYTFYIEFNKAWYEANHFNIF